jgi:hypothetical protein
VAEQGCLLSSYPGKTGIGGSNPPLSAIPIQLSSAKPSERSLANLLANRQFYWDSLGTTQSELSRKTNISPVISRKIP